MIVLDANILIYSFREELPQHPKTLEWLQKTLETSEVGIPTPSELAFLRLSSRSLGPLPAAPWEKAWAFMQALFGTRRGVRIHPGLEHPEIMNELVTTHQLVGDALVDAWLASIALERGCLFATADKGFARFAGLRLVNPTR